jgi:hypothetical protein
MPNGLRLRFVAKPGLLAELACIIEQEQTCCGFLQFHLAIEAGKGPSRKNQPSLVSMTATFQD